MVIRIIKNPVGLYNLSYEVGEEITLPDLQAAELIETGHAEFVEAENAMSKVKPEKAIKVRK